MEVAKTPTYPVMCRLQFLLHYVITIQQRYRRTDRQTDASEDAEFLRRQTDDRVWHLILWSRDYLDLSPYLGYTDTVRLQSFSYIGREWRAFWQW